MMKKIPCTLAFCAAVSAFGQGTFQFDQQSSSDETPLGYGVGAGLSTLLPSTGQSFTPALSGVNFVRLKFDDGAPGDTFGATLYLNLRSQSMAGPILGTTTPVNMPDGFNGTQDFFFPSTVTLTPGDMYYFELVVQSAFNWDVDIGPFNYSGGEAFVRGQPYPGGDYWFREGIAVPEPYPSLFIALGAGIFVLIRHRGRPFGDDRL